jgi:hypothetical protein
MTHDSYCELESSRYQQCKDCMAWAGVQQIHCHCASRAFPLCNGCRSGSHAKHVEVAPSRGERCICDLCVDEVAS